MVLGSRLQKTLKRWVRNGGDLWSILHADPSLRVESARDALSVCRALEHASALLPTQREAQEMMGTPLYALTGLFHEVGAKAARRILTNKGLPQLDDIVQRHLYAERFVPQEDVLHIFKIMASYHYGPGVRHLGAALRRDYALDHYLWSLIFALFAEPGHPGGGALAERIGGANLRGCAETGWLLLANVLAESDQLDGHPFNHAAGRERLRQFLQAEMNDDGWVRAIEATKALAFQQPADIRTLLELAERHPHPRVRLQALGVRTRKMVAVDRADFVQRLVSHAENPRHSRQACQLLEEAGALEVVPERVEDPEFRALVDLCETLEEWGPFSEAPDHMEVIDSRELHWPPSASPRVCSLCRFVYLRGPQEKGRGLAVVHSRVTLFIGSLADGLDVDDLYAFFCAHESAPNVSPNEVSVSDYVARGHELLERHREACGERKKAGPLLVMR